MSPPRQSVADVVGATVAAEGVAHAFGVIGSGNLVVTNALVNGGALFHHARHEGGAICMADGYGRVSGKVGGLQRPPGARTDEHDDRPHRGSQEPHPTARSRRRDTGRGADLELQDRPARPGRIGGCDRRPRTRSGDRRRRRATRLSTHGRRTKAGRADAADRHPDPAAAADRAAQPPDAVPAKARAARRGDPAGSRPARERRAAGDHRRARRRDRRRARRALLARSAERSRARDLGACQRAVRGSPLRARDLRRLRGAVSCRS